MLTKIKGLVVRNRVENLLKKHNVELLHYTPGRIRVKLLSWKNKEHMVERLIHDLKKDPDVQSVKFTEQTGTILLFFNHAALENPNAHGRWLHLFHKYNL